MNLNEPNNEFNAAPMPSCPPQGIASPPAYYPYPAQPLSKEEQFRNIVLKY